MGFSIQVELEIREVGFVEGGKPMNPEKNPRNKAPERVEPGPHWWKSRALELTTEPSLLPATDS